jgi:hypothetical protein
MLSFCRYGTIRLGASAIAIGMGCSEVDKRLVMVFVCSDPHLHLYHMHSTYRLGASLGTYN